jgi:hypothetical protein
VPYPFFWWFSTFADWRTGIALACGLVALPAVAVTAAVTTFSRSNGDGPTGRRDTR